MAELSINISQDQIRNAVREGIKIILQDMSAGDELKQQVKEIQERISKQNLTTEKKLAEIFCRKLKEADKLNPETVLFREITRNNSWLRNFLMDAVKESVKEIVGEYFSQALSVQVTLRSNEEIPRTTKEGD